MLCANFDLDLLNASSDSAINLSFHRLLAGGKSMDDYEILGFGKRQKGIAPFPRETFSGTAAFRAGILVIIAR